jgi:hypothetical protein
MRIILFCFIGLYFNSIAQDSLFMKLGGDIEYDAALGGSTPNSNWEYFPDFHATAWTCGGILCIDRSLIKFNLSSIPAGAIITGASFSLFAATNTINAGGNAMVGENASYLQRIISPWDKSIVTSNTQPQTTQVNQVLLPKSSVTFQNYLNINITQLIIDMLNDPQNSHGLLIRLVEEEPYNAMIFASGNNPNAALWPEIRIIYQSTVGMKSEDVKSSFNFYPNPAINEVYVEFSDSGLTIDIINLYGKVIASKRVTGNSEKIDISSFPSGVYFFQAKTANGIVVKKIIKN